jgi:hypothetical protein
LSPNLSSVHFAPVKLVAQTIQFGIFLFNRGVDAHVRSTGVRVRNKTGSLPLRIMGGLGLALATVIVAFAQNPANSIQVSGVVLDANGAVITEAKVTLLREGAPTEQTTATNQKGEFRFTRLASGKYEITIQKDGFKPIVTPLSIGSQTPAPLRIVLPIAEVHEEIVIADRSNQVS